MPPNTGNAENYAGSYPDEGGSPQSHSDNNNHSFPANLGSAPNDLSTPFARFTSFHRNLSPAQFAYFSSVFTWHQVDTIDPSLLTLQHPITTSTNAQSSRPTRATAIFANMNSPGMFNSDTPSEGSPFRGGPNNESDSDENIPKNSHLLGDWKTEIIWERNKVEFHTNAAPIIRDANFLLVIMENFVSHESLIDNPWRFMETLRNGITRAIEIARELEGHYDNMLLMVRRAAELGSPDAFLNPNLAASDPMTRIERREKVDTAFVRITNTAKDIVKNEWKGKYDIYTELEFRELLKGMVRQMIKILSFNPESMDYKLYYHGTPGATFGYGGKV